MMQLLQNMSAHNMMASIGRTLGKSDNKLSTTNEVRFAGDGRKDKLYEPKHKQKLVRVLTVIAYVIFVSLAAILLSLYYTFVWNPKDQAVRKRIDKPECPKPSLDFLTIPPIFNETQIERIIARSMMIDNKQPNKDLLTTQRQKEISTETTDIEETSVELTPVSTARDYHNNFTSVANDAVGDVT
ncbi:uncharacterized protein LOC109862477 [Pseudomyrmex gracilis]|uniref:uncharacterized protein LOC109862477 n=1 Tax=Pseudomyrmex gracilis TaxID=219809 RepID=UPI0009953C0D|nr:uncharacterized protein LOC109862477 [Pseudomyrmex gracilis]XP_020298134.1 uncharacterized protein LOC109862477 [Pseudomyrmex gracilis]